LSKMPQPFWLIKAALNRGGSISLEPFIKLFGRFTRIEGW
jgi:hypothetical protein